MADKNEDTEINVIKSDTIEADEDIDIYHQGSSLRIERLSEKSVFVAGYNGGENGNTDYRYWFNVNDDGDLEISREVIKDD